MSKSIYFPFAGIRKSIYFSVSGICLFSPIKGFLEFSIGVTYGNIDESMRRGSIFAFHFLFLVCVLLYHYAVRTISSSRLDGCSGLFGLTFKPFFLGPGTYSIGFAPKFHADSRSRYVNPMNMRPNIAIFVFS